jgi:hypothetical protein
MKSGDRIYIWNSTEIVHMWVGVKVMLLMNNRGVAHGNKPPGNPAMAMKTGKNSNYMANIAGQSLINLFLKKPQPSISPSCASHSFNRMYPIKNPLRTKKTSTPIDPFANGVNNGTQFLP